MAASEHPVLRASPLKSVVCQLRFPQILGLSDEKVRPIQVALSSIYPDVAKEEAQQVQIGPGGIRAGETEQVYQFREHGGHWFVALNRGSLSLETTRYSMFSEFLARWETLAALVAGELEVRHQDRLGFRYINELPLGGEGIESLSAVVRQQLIGIVGMHERTQRLIGSVHELRFQQEDGACTIRHGYVRKPDGGHTYMLDFDYYDEEGKTFDLVEQTRRLAAYNHGMFELFRALVTPEAFESYDPVKRSRAGA